MVIAFDVDDTLIVPSIAIGREVSGESVPNYPVIEVYRFFQEQGHTMIVWSGSGIDWATRWAEKLGLFPDAIMAKGGIEVDIAFDDCDVVLGKVNVKVKRKEWNETKHDL